MKKENIVFFLIAIIVGVLGGYLIFSVSSKKEAAPVGGGVPVGAGTAADYRLRIETAEKIVAAEPKNRQAWVQLGNDYFDTGQPQKAVNAYAKALELKPDDPNVLTDQGVMYRQLKQFDLAIANFEKAQQLNPNHLQSLFNLGMVYAQDLKQDDKAIKAWNRYLELDPSSPTAQQIKGMIEQLKTSPKGFK
ncbi:MAG TPA: tetratricopeptide repeat protein [Geobacteraceae bacterium]|nr:tetratricopeptide repeat protein [Geobacteraceae bacterium]